MDASTPYSQNSKENKQKWTQNHVTVTVKSFCSWEINIQVRLGAIFLKRFFDECFYPTDQTPLPGTDGQDICFLNTPYFHSHPPDKNQITNACKLSKLPDTIRFQEMYMHG